MTSILINKRKSAFLLVLATWPTSSCQLKYMSKKEREINAIWIDMEPWGHRFIIDESINHGKQVNIFAGQRTKMQYQEILKILAWNQTWMRGRRTLLMSIKANESQKGRKYMGNKKFSFFLWLFFFLSSEECGGLLLVF